MCSRSGHVPVYDPLPAPPTTGLRELLEKKNISLLDPNSSRRALFDKNSKSCLPIGSVVEIETWDDYPTKSTFQSFAGHMIAVRRRGIDTSFRLRTVISRLGVEQVFKLYSPNIKAIRILHRGAVRGKRYKRAKLFFTRTPGTRNTLGGVENVLRKARTAEREVKAERERLLAKKGVAAEQPEKLAQKKRK
jgi:ribosomal protein L19